MRIQNRLIKTILATAACAAGLMLATPASAQQSTGGPGVGEWALAIEPTAAEWPPLNFVEKIASSINEDITNLGGGWHYGIGDNYYFFETPYIYNLGLDTWFYAVHDITGVYFYNFSLEFWDWRSRDGETSGL